MSPARRMSVLAPRYLWAGYFVVGFVLTGVYAHNHLEINYRVMLLFRLTATLLAVYSIYWDSLQKTGAPKLGYCAAAAVLWPLIGPIYLIETRRWRGLSLILLFLAATFISFALPRLIFDNDLSL